MILLGGIVAVRKRQLCAAELPSALYWACREVLPDLHATNRSTVRHGAGEKRASARPSRAVVTRRRPVGEIKGPEGRFRLIWPLNFDPAGTAGRETTVASSLWRKYCITKSTLGNLKQLVLHCLPAREVESQLDWAICPINTVAAHRVDADERGPTLSATVVQERGHNQAPRETSEALTMH